MFSLFAHPGHPGDSDNPIIHGIAHWIFSVPILTVIILGLLVAVLWHYNQPDQDERSADE